MKANITNVNKESEVLCVTVNGECNHADVLIDQIDCGGIQYRNGEPDWEDDWRTVLVCSKCRAWRYDEDSLWDGVTFFPEPYIHNNGELVLR